MRLDESNHESSNFDKKSSQGSERPSFLSQQNNKTNTSDVGDSKQNSEKKNSIAKKKKVVLMHHHLHSVNNSGSLSGINSAKNSNRPSKTSNNDVQRTNSHGLGDNIFDKASLILQLQYSSELPPKPHVTFCNPKE